MKQNMGTADRALRVVAAVVLAGLYFLGYVSGAVGVVLLVIAVVFLLTSLVGFCPLYTLCGWNTCPADSCKIDGKK